jgi:hypothetical protein
MEYKIHKPMIARFFTGYILLFIFFRAIPASALTIGQNSDSLRVNACAIMNNYSAVLTQTDINNATFTVSKVITILDKQGEYYARFYEYGDKFNELKDFSGIIKNASGAVVKKIGKKDLSVSSLSEGLMDDDYSISYDCKQPAYPYTVEYNYSVKMKNGIISYPRFNPVPGILIAVEKAAHKVELPLGMNLKYDSNFDCNMKEEKTADKHIYTFSASNMKAIDYEPLAPSFSRILPRVLMSPTDFCFDSHCGNMSTWNDYGLWVSGLLKDRDILPNDFITRLQELTQGAESDRRKVEILYNYLQNNFRYVSIQLGIGGLQPAEASSVLKSKFGDCKGLSNIMKAMLKAVDISSNYCEIYMGRQKELKEDFPSVSQTNHVILLVPLKNDSIWLECTSQKIPFGYVHDDIAGHDALVITSSGGKICRLPSYTSRQNKKESVLDITITEEGTANGKIQFTEYLHQYGNNFRMMASKDREKEMKYINENMNMPKIQVSQINVSENKSPFPSCSMSIGFMANDFINKTGTRLFATVCPLKKDNYNVFSSGTRNQDIEIADGYSETDSVTFNIPESYTVESLPKNISLKTPFGIFETECKADGNKIVYTQNIDIFTGKYDKSKYKEIKAFYSEINSAVKRKLVLKKI